jgi:hypothetical protein
MNIIKIILIALGVFAAFLVITSLLGLVYSIIWYLFWIGVLALGGYVGYKVLKGFTEDESKQLGETTAGYFYDDEIAPRTLEEMKRKYELKD